MSIKKFNISNALSRVEASVGLVHANLTDSKKVTDNIHRVVIAFNTEKCSKQEKIKAICKLFDSHATPIIASFRQIPEAYQYSVVGYVAQNNEAKEYTEEMASSGQFKALAGNILMDETDESLWEVTSSKDNLNKYLVRTGMEDLSDLVALAKLKNEVPRNRSISLSSVITGTTLNDYVAYVCPNSYEVKYGYVIEASDCVYSDDMQDSEIEILDRESITPVKVNPELVVESASLNDDDLDNLPDTETAAEYDLANKGSLSAYYKKMFEYAPEYYAELEKIINEHAEV